MKSGVQADQVCVQPATQVGDDFFAQQCDEIEAGSARQREHHRNCEQQCECLVDLRIAGEALIDHALDRCRQAQCGGSGNRQRDQPGNEQAALALDEWPQGAQAAQLPQRVGTCSGWLDHAASGVERWTRLPVASHRRVFKPAS